MESHVLRRWLALASLGIGQLLVICGLAISAFSDRAALGSGVVGALSAGAGVFVMLWVLPDVLCHLRPPPGQAQPSGDERLDRDTRLTTDSHGGARGDAGRPTSTAQIIPLAKVRPKTLSRHPISDGE